MILTLVCSNFDRSVVDRKESKTTLFVKKIQYHNYVHKRRANLTGGCKPGAKSNVQRRARGCVGEQGALHSGKRTDQNF